MVTSERGAGSAIEIQLLVSLVYPLTVRAVQ